ncbi:MAG: sulfurtransferase [Gammaproteobacteria bacterium]|nr:sulfurtransferase [Gammaproteobacteria bacterium]
MPKFQILIIFLCFSFSISLTRANSLLVETDWLANNLQSPQIALIDMSDSMQYSRFHIPGARHLPYNAINQHTRQRTSVSVGSQKIATIMEQLGINPTMHIVIYDDTAGLNAARLFWELERLGHQKLSILNGGLVKWILEGRKVVANHKNYPKTQYQPNLKSGRDNLAKLSDISHAKQVLLDVRSQDEYTGHPRQKRSGHIPGALWWNWEDNVNFNDAFQIQSDSSLLNRINQLKINDKKQQIIVYCRSGHRASHSYFTLRKLGYTNIRLYDGSMAEYSQMKNTELRRGNKP